jgi:hypothetical protein
VPWCRVSHRALLLVHCTSQAATALRSPTAWPLLSEAPRLWWLRACCAVAEGAAVPLRHSTASQAAACVSAVLSDDLRRLSVLGGREGMPRSLGSVYCGAVTRFIGGGCRGAVSRIIAMRGGVSYEGGVAVSRDGSRLLVTDRDGGSDAVIDVHWSGGPRERVFSNSGEGPLDFNSPCQVWVARDDYVFVADMGNCRVQVLTPALDFYGVVGAGHLTCPIGVCANDEFIVVSEDESLAVFSRRTGTLLRRIGADSVCDGQKWSPSGLCFMSDDRHFAVADAGNGRVSVFSVDGVCIRHVGAGLLSFPRAVACSAFDELVVADWRNCHVAIFSASGDLMKTLRGGSFAGVAVHGCTIFAQTAHDNYPESDELFPADAVDDRVFVFDLGDESTSHPSVSVKKRAC